MSGLSDPSSSPKRQISPSTGLSYLSNHSATSNYQRLYIFIHGWACCAQDFVPLISTLSTSNLAPNTLFVAPDLPGHGYTPQSICPNPTVPACACLINDLRRELELELSPTSDIQTTIVGHSMGCRITLEVFSQEPTSITGLVLLDGSWYGPAPKDYKPISGSDAEELQNVLDVFDTMMGPATPEDFRQQAQQHLRQMDLDYTNQLRREYIAWDGKRMEEALSTVGSANVRVLVVQGTEGHGAKRKSLKKGQEGPWMQLVKAKAGDRYTGVIVESSGHWPHVDKVQDVTDAIEIFGKGT
jgi:pimeloyl-ACP methyl ester carboxylesterase